MRELGGYGAALALGVLVGTTWMAVAQEPGSGSGSAEASGSESAAGSGSDDGVAEATAAPKAPEPIVAPPVVAGATRCALFERSLVPPAQVDSEDTSAPLGQWIAAHRATGWTLGEITFQTAQKPTCYPMGLTHVCVVGR